MQVYRDLRIITARPSAGGGGAGAAPALWPCRCGGELFGRALVRGCRARRSTRRRRGGRVPILVGGTGLYFKALTQGLVGGAADPARDPRRGAGALRRRGRGGAARRACPRAIRRRRRGSMPGDRMRIARALEVLEATGRSLADWHRDGMPAILDPDARAEGFSGRRPRRAAPPDRRALRRHAGGRRAGRGAGAGRARPRPDAAGDEGAWRALAAPASRRRDQPGGGGRRRQAATPAATPSGRSPGSATRCRTGRG